MFKNVSTSPIVFQRKYQLRSVNAIEFIWDFFYSRGKVWENQEEYSVATLLGFEPNGPQSASFIPLANSHFMMKNVYHIQLEILQEYQLAPLLEAEALMTTIMMLLPGNTICSFRQIELFIQKQFPIF